MAVEGLPLPMTREVPRPFKMPWGRGEIVEEVSVRAPHWEPTIQLMEYEDGSRALRFCYYSEGRFGRGPMMLGEKDLGGMAEAIGRSKHIRRLMQKMAGGA